jgi:putative membrane protein
MRAVYFFILISHVVLSIPMVPMCFTTLYFSWRGTFARHKKLARWTFPIWLYVSVTGVLVFAMLRAAGA